MSTDSSHYQFKHHPETCDPDDIWGQVKRTVKGEPVPAEQIALIVDAISQGLQLKAQDRLLDLCCGNGALTTQLFGRCAGGLGVDYSGFLIDVARQRFVRRGSEGFRMADAVAHLEDEAAAADYTQVLCYGAFPYFDTAMALRMLQLVHQRYNNVGHVFLGQLPDKTRMQDFFTTRQAQPGEADDPGSLMGIWRTPEEMAALAAAAGWRAECRRMPHGFYAAHYRYDAVLTRL
jgi:SAM-dependent methyltransferase